MVSSESKSTALDRGKKRSPLRSIGAKLFIAVIGGAVVGLGSAAYLFYQNLENQTTIKIQKAVDIEVKAIEIELTAVVQATTDLGGATKFLTEQQIQDDRVYESLVLEFFNKRPQLSMAAYFMQTPRGILKSKEWYSPYFYLDQKAEGQLGKRLPAPNERIIYSELFKDDDYPIRDYYQIPFKKKGSAWIEPYLWYGSTITTFATPIVDKNKNLIGFSAADVNVTEIAKNISPTVIDNNGYFTLISEEGRLISYSPDPKKAVDRVSYDTIPELKAVWLQIGDKKEGLIQKNGKYWTFRRLPSTNWLMLAAVPESIVQMPILGITLAGTIGAGLVLAGAVFWFVSYLNKRLKPILTECENMVGIDPEIQQQIGINDEIEGLSISLFELLRQLKANQERLLQESEKNRQQAELIQGEAKNLNNDVEELLDVVSSLEEGDFTVEAEVSDRATGLVADTLNRLIEELAGTLGSVVSTVRQVTDSAGDLEKMALNTSQQAQEQARSVSDIRALVENVNSISQNTAEQALISSEAVRDARKAVERGEEEIVAMAEEINILQEGTQQIIKRALTLNDFVALAAQFAEDQKRVAALTRVLALNASMVASRASAQEDPEQFIVITKEFETIARQVNDLAVQTNQGLLRLKQSTDRIETVVSGITQDIQEIDRSVGQFDLSVQNSRMAFNNIKEVTEKVDLVGREVTNSSMSIAELTETTLRSVENIAQTIAETELSSQFTSEKAGLMDRLSRTLLERVSFFRLKQQ
jgi:methyl-accepting chemotaxis protein PixJ